MVTLPLSLSDCDSCQFILYYSITVNYSHLLCFWSRIPKHLCTMHVRCYAKFRKKNWKWLGGSRSHWRNFFFFFFNFAKQLSSCHMYLFRLSAWMFARVVRCRTTTVAAVRRASRAAFPSTVHISTTRKKTITWTRPSLRATGSNPPTPATGQDGAVRPAVCHSTTSR